MELPDILLMILAGAVWGCFLSMVISILRGFAGRGDPDKLGEVMITSAVLGGAAAPLLIPIFKAVF